MAEVKKKSAATKTAAAKEKVQKSPVIEVEATEECPFDEKDNQVVIEIKSEIIPSVDEVISKEITKYDRVIPAVAELKKEYMGLKIAGIDDKEGYDKVSKGLRFVTSKATAVENVRKQLKAPYWDIGVAIDKRAKEITEMISPIKNYLKETKQVIDDEIKERDRLLEEQKQVMLQKRNDMLIQAGMSLIGNTYVWKDPFDADKEETLLYVNIETMDDKTFNEEVQNIVNLQAAANQKKKDEQERIAKEKAAQIEREEAVKKERESIRNEKIQMRLDFLTELGCSVSLYREKRTFGLVDENVVYFEFKNKGFTVCTKDSLADVENWSSLMSDTKAKIAEIKDAVAKDEENANETKIKEEALNKRTSERINALELIGLSVSELTGFVFYKNKSITSIPEVRAIEEDVWQDKVTEFNKRMLYIDAEINKQQQEERQKNIEAAKKQLEEEEKKREAEKAKLEAEELERVTNLNDKQKLSEYVTALLAVKAPEFKTPKYKTIQANIEKALNQYK